MTNGADVFNSPPPPHTRVGRALRPEDEHSSCIIDVLSIGDDIIPTYLQGLTELIIQAPDAATPGHTVRCSAGGALVVRAGGC